MYNRNSVIFKNMLVFCRISLIFVQYIFYIRNASKSKDKILLCAHPLKPGICKLKQALSKDI